MFPSDKCGPLILRKLYEIDNRVNEDLDFCNIGKVIQISIQKVGYSPICLTVLKFAAFPLDICNSIPDVEVEGSLQTCDYYSQIFVLGIYESKGNLVKLVGTCLLCRLNPVQRSSFFVEFVCCKLVLVKFGPIL